MVVVQEEGSVETDEGQQEIGETAERGVSECGIERSRSGESRDE